MNKEPPVLVTAHDRGDAMQPPLPNRFGSLNDSQHTVLRIDVLNQVTHVRHDLREYSWRGRRYPERLAQPTRTMRVHSGWAEASST